uniref:Cadherin domain-containing protein n=1 Tax=Oryzias latipes TaxID=8090 RepID=A0A3P9ML34_ORYLA
MAVLSSAEESPCKPGFDSDLIFKVNRKHLKKSRRLGKGMLTSSNSYCFMLPECGCTAGHPDVAILYFPKLSNGLRRMKRDWVIPPINIPENSNGPFPYKMVQKILYSITGPGATEDPVGLFTIEKDTGDLYVHQRLDREKQAHYTLFVHADSAGSSKAEDPMEIFINVIDMNDNKPIFEQTSYAAKVAESSPKGTTVIQVKATDADEPGNDNSEIRYTILSQEPKLPSDSMFAINSFNGAIMVEGVGLDRKYTLKIQAADIEGEGLSGRTTVVLKVTDSNNNPPVFTASTVIDENAVGVLVFKLSVTDKDEPNSPAWNAKFKIIRGDPDNLFSIETGTYKQEGIIKTAKGLDFEKSRTHTLEVIAENDVPFAIPLTTSTATVVVTVKDVNEPPIFKEKEMTVQKPEDVPVDCVIIKSEAEDPDLARENAIKYKIIDDPDNWLTVDEDSGLVKVKSLMDRESPNVKENKYTALLGAYDNDPVPATGTGTLVIILEDVNDNPPFIEERNITVCMDASAPVLLTVTDRDGPFHSDKSRDIFQSKVFFSVFAETKVELVLKSSVLSGTYQVILRVSDTDGLEQNCTIQAKVCNCVDAPLRNSWGVKEQTIRGVVGGILLLSSNRFSVRRREQVFTRLSESYKENMNSSSTSSSSSSSSNEEIIVLLNDERRRKRRRILGTSHSYNKRRTWGVLSTGTKAENVS